jgi:P4 family phage/plasmid primase-like protien
MLKYNMNIGESVFYEKINIKKLNYILNNRSKYETIIKEQEEDMRRTDKNYNAYAVFQKIKENVFIPNELKDTDFAYLKITYKKGTKSNDIGRWYCHKGIGIQPLCVSVRHTICDGLWVDIDQVNSHPTILKNFMDKYKLKSSLLNDCLQDREAFLAKIMKEDKCNRSTAKTKVIATINGKKYKSKTLMKLADELEPIIKHIINLDEYKDIKEYVEETYKEDKNISGKTISRILQVIENDLLETYVEFFINKGLIEKYADGYEVALIFDGLQLRMNEKITEEILNECRLYALNKTGYDIELKVKPFDCQLELPENLENNDDDLTSLIDKYEVGLNNYLEIFTTDINNCLSSGGSHASVSKITKLILKDTIVYDESNKSWFYCNIKNVWIKSNTPFIYKGLLKSIFHKFFLIVSQYYNNLILNMKDEGMKELYNNKSSTAFKISLNLQNASYLENIVKIAVIDFNKSKFFETKIDSNGNLFAFKNKVLDCRTLEIRDIKPNDYIMNNTGYDYPEYTDEDLKTIIEDYYKTIYPDEEVREYMWNNDALSLNGERLFQTFNIHTGKGSNSKSTKFTMLKSILGDYFCEINAETFTKQPKSANATSELHKTKGTRVVFFNEPENDGDNKLQVALLKKMADGYKGTLKARGLYAESVEFPIFFRVEGCCNNKPTLSSTDGGISRRVRVIHYPVQFVENPDPNNKHETLLNLEMGQILTTDAIRNTYVRLLIERFINVASQIRKENIPQQVNQDSLDYVADSNVVLGFITEFFNITKDEKDVISSSSLYNDFRMKGVSNKMTPSKFKDDMTNIQGITFKKKKDGNYFCGLAEKAF